MKYQHNILATSITTCLMLICATTHAAPTVPTNNVPDAGQLLQQQQQGQTLAPQTAVEIESSQNNTAPNGSDVQIAVEKIEIVGNSRFSA